jgi:FtsH-binding integral membrane protein
MGVMMAPMLSMVADLDSDLILIAGAITASTMAGLVHFARVSPNKLHWGASLHIALWALIGNGVISLIFGVPEPMFWIDCIGGTALFTAITVYDTQKAIEGYKNGRPDHISHAAAFYLDFMNLFLRVLNVLVKMKGQQSTTYYRHDDDRHDDNDRHD